MLQLTQTVTLLCLALSSAPAPAFALPAAIPSAGVHAAAHASVKHVDHHLKANQQHATVKAAAQANAQANAQAKVKPHTHALDTITDPALAAKLFGLEAHLQGVTALLNSKGIAIAKRDNPGSIVDGIPILGGILGPLLSSTAGIVAGLPILGPLLQSLGGTLAGLPLAGPLIKLVGNGLDLGPLVGGATSAMVKDGRSFMDLKPDHYVDLAGHIYTLKAATGAAGDASSGMPDNIAPLIDGNGKLFYVDAKQLVAAGKAAAGAQASAAPSAQVAAVMNAEHNDMAAMPSDIGANLMKQIGKAVSSALDAVDVPTATRDLMAIPKPTYDLGMARITGAFHASLNSFAAHPSSRVAQAKPTASSVFTPAANLMQSAEAAATPDPTAYFFVSEHHATPADGTAKATSTSGSMLHRRKPADLQVDDDCDDEVEVKAEHKRLRARKPSLLKRWM